MASLAVQRFLSKKDRNGLGRHRTKTKSSTAIAVASEAPSADYHGLFTSKVKPVDSQEEQRIKALRKRVMEAKSINLQDPQILYALRSPYASGDFERSFELLLAMSNAWEGLLVGYDPGVKLLGAVNRGGVTCYLDSLLFAMFSRLDSFEAMLYHTFEDNAKNKLGMLLRLWVNLLRSGKLITTDVTQMLQESLAECGWEEAAQLHQQDASEAFTFITEKLELPLLTLKMDIYHTGREDATDDHKFINERLLEVAIPPEPVDPQGAVPLEDCLEAYFNNRIEVKRYLERQSTTNSGRAYSTAPGMPMKDGAIHIENVEISKDTPSGIPTLSNCRGFDLHLRQRAASIVRQRFIPDVSSAGSPPAYEADVKLPPGRFRSGSIRKEVMMPAWQFFSLIPWYTNNTPKNDAQVAAHFSSKRPILGICLKRYSFTDGGNALRLTTRIDIPTEIGLPHFISDDSMDEDGPIYGNFKLSLQSVVCHRGNSVNSGHYISLVKGTSLNGEASNAVCRHSMQDSIHWMRFDDLATERITLVDIKQALKDETPYLLFYQIVPIDSGGGTTAEWESLPLYAPSEAHDSGISGISPTSLKLPGSSEETPLPPRTSIEIIGPEGNVRGRSSSRQLRRESTVVSESANHDELAVPDLESSQPSLVAASVNAKGGRQSRSQGQTGEKFSISLSRMARRKSKESVPVLENTAEEDETNGVVLEASTAEDEKGRGFLRREGRREKSKSRLGRVSGISGKGKGEKPDRECSVM